MKTLVFWDGGPAATARRLRDEGASFLLWNPERRAELDGVGVPFRTEADFLSAEEADRIDEAAIAWTKQWGRRPLRDGRRARDLLCFRGVSLWWLAELYLFHSTAAPAYVRLVETFDRLLEATDPEEVVAVGLPPIEAVLLGRVATARRILFDGPRSLPSLPFAWKTVRVSLESRWNTLKILATAVKAALTGPPPRPPDDGRRTVLFLSHAAFWRERRDPETGAPRPYEHYFDRLIPGVDDTPGLRSFVVAVGPRAAFRRRGVRERASDWMRLRADTDLYVHVNRYCTTAVYREVRAAAREIRKAWAELRRSPAVAEAFSHRGVSFADLTGPDLAATLLLQLPWGVRCFEEMAAALAEVRPAAVCLYAESSGWGRAALAACRAAGVPTVAVQHGILYPKYYSYRHDPDEGDCPRPDRTAVFGEAARAFLVERGAYAPHSLVVTGSPRFDDLLRAARSWDRAALRARWGVGEADRLLAVASRYKAIRETHAAIGPAFPALVRALESLPGVHALVKPHPAEPAAAYEADLRRAGAARVRVVPPGADLMELLFAADALVTVESLSAVEALVLSRPVVILNMPTHLAAMVERGVALGVGKGEDPTEALRAALFDLGTQERLARARERYVSELAFGADGKATERILALIRDTAAGVVGF